MPDAPRESPRTSAREAVTPVRPVVLVVDDEPLVRMVLEAVLTGQGCDVRLTSCGREALEVYRRHRGDIDLILLDVLRMPVMDGLATLKALRAIDPGVRCCLITGDSTGDDAEAGRLLGLGADDVLPKPFAFDDIRDLVGGLVAGAGRRKVLAYGLVAS